MLQASYVEGALLLLNICPTSGVSVEMPAKHPPISWAAFLLLEHIVFDELTTLVKRRLYVRFSLDLVVTDTEFRDLARQTSRLTCSRVPEPWYVFC